jgi:hypothetical protein
VSVLSAWFQASSTAGALPIHGISTGLLSFITMTVVGLMPSSSSSIRFWSLSMLASGWSAPSVATRPAISTIASAALAAVFASSTLDRSSATVTLLTVADEPRSRRTSC